MKNLPVSVLVSVRGRDIPLCQVKDPAVVRAFQQLAEQVGSQLCSVVCNVHKKGPTAVRLVVDKGGNADLRYESCCVGLRDQVGRVLG
jgi:hypothetical protein